MRNFKTLVTVAAVLAGMTSPAAADDSRWGVGLKAGTLGLGIEARWAALSFLDLRLGGNAYSYATDRRYADVRYEADFTLETYYLTANFHFPLTPFRFTAGAFANGNEAILVGAESGDYVLGGQVWTQAQVGTLTGITTFSSTSPYLGLGFDFEVFGKAGVNFDVGVLWQGDPQVSLTAAGGTEAGNPLFEAAVQQEAIQLANDLNSFKAYPVASLSFVYNF